MPDENTDIQRAMEEVHRQQFSIADIVEVLNDRSLHISQAKRTAILSRFKDRMKGEN